VTAARRLRDGCAAVARRLWRGSRGAPARACSAPRRAAPARARGVPAGTGGARCFRHSTRPTHLRKDPLALRKCSGLYIRKCLRVREGGGACGSWRAARVRKRRRPRPGSQPSSSSRPIRICNRTKLPRHARRSQYTPANGATRGEGEERGGPRIEPPFVHPALRARGRAARRWSRPCERGAACPISTG